MPLYILGRNKHKFISESLRVIVSSNFTHLQNCVINLLTDISEMLPLLYSHQYDKGKKAKQETGK